MMLLPYIATILVHLLSSSTSIIIRDQMHDGICVKKEESTWKSCSHSSMMKYTSPPLQKDQQIIFSFCSCCPTPPCCLPGASLHP